ncbi:hypothetical protein [Paludibaculum fermentans]|uniref:hypothetical protein n=1 Tax=Paludibaculum fermentans TaxID=1473598 RepID=UPI003EB9995A
MTIDETAMASVFEDAFLPFVVREHGEAAGPAVRSILTFIRGFYTHIAPEGRSGKIIIFQSLDPTARPIPKPGLVCSSVTEVVNKIAGHCAIQIIPSGTFILWAKHAIDPAVLSVHSVVYSFYQGAEYFHANKKSKHVVKLLPGRSSNFAVPTFSSLREALSSYRDTIARTSSCEILNTAWYDRKRLFFIAGPEETIRRSLTRFLKITLNASAEVRPEQIVDESHPVDIKVTWFMTNRLALIEIKWLGVSRDSVKIRTSYSASRARSGAKQLANYMDSNRIQAPIHEARGYLVVMDARRAKLVLNSSTISAIDGMKFADAEIEYDPQYHESRDDFENPIRMFVAPECAP